jgi:probable phosphoglycerate mutase
MDLLLIRHAEPVRIENADGPADPVLHERGHEQATRLGAWLKAESLDAVVTSPLRRAVQTASAIGATPEVIDGLAEYDRHVNWYVPIEDLKAAKDERWDAMVAGDYLGDDTFPTRVVETIEALIDQRPGQRVAAVCHGGVINVYLAWVLGLTNPMFFLPRYTSISRVAGSRDGVRSVVSLNETGHLRGLPGF